MVGVVMFMRRLTVDRIHCLCSPADCGLYEALKDW